MPVLSIPLSDMPILSIPQPLSSLAMMLQSPRHVFPFPPLYTHKQMHAPPTISSGLALMPCTFLSTSALMLPGPFLLGTLLVFARPLLMVVTWESRTVLTAVVTGVDTAVVTVLVSNPPLPPSSSAGLQFVRIRTWGAA